MIFFSVFWSFSAASCSLKICPFSSFPNFPIFAAISRWNSIPSRLFFHFSVSPCFREPRPLLYWQSGRRLLFKLIFKKMHWALFYPKKAHFGFFYFKMFFPIFLIFLLFPDAMKMIRRARPKSYVLATSSSIQDEVSSSNINERELLFLTKNWLEKSEFSTGKIEFLVEKWKKNFLKLKKKMVKIEIFIFLIILKKWWSSDFLL